MYSYKLIGTYIGAIACRLNVVKNHYQPRCDPLNAIYIILNHWPCLLYHHVIDSDINSYIVCSKQVLYGVFCFLSLFIYLSFYSTLPPLCLTPSHNTSVSWLYPILTHLTSHFIPTLSLLYPTLFYSTPLYPHSTLTPPHFIAILPYCTPLYPLLYPHSIPTLPQLYLTLPHPLSTTLPYSTSFYHTPFYPTPLYTISLYSICSPTLRLHFTSIHSDSLRSLLHSNSLYSAWLSTPQTRI